MKLLRDNFVPTLIILLASVLVSLAILPLGSTDMAQEARSGESADGEEEPLEGGEGTPILLMWVGPLIKFSLFTAVGFAIVGIGTWVTRFFNRIFRPSIEKP